MSLVRTTTMTAALFAIMAATGVANAGDKLVWAAYIADTELDDGTATRNGSGGDVGLKIDIKQLAYLFAQYDVAEYDFQGGNVEVGTLALGLGMQYAFNEKFTGYASVSAEQIETETLTGGTAVTSDDNGYGLRAGVKFQLHERVWVNPEYQDVTLDKTDAQFFVGRIGFTLNEKITLFGEARTGDYEHEDQDDQERFDFRVGVSYRFIEKADSSPF